MYVSVRAGWVSVEMMLGEGTTKHGTEIRRVNMGMRLGGLVWEWN